MTQKVQYPLQLIERIRIVARIWSSFPTERRTRKQEKKREIEIS